MNRGHIYIILNAIFFGISIPISQVSVATVPVWLFTAMTLGIACVAILPAAKAVDGVKWTKLGTKNYFGIIMQALFGCVLYTLFLLYGLTYSSAISIAVINSLTPAFTLIFSFILLRESLSFPKILAIALAISSVLVMSLTGVAGGSGGSLFGSLLMLLAVVSVSLFFIYAKKFSVELPTFTLTAGLLFASFIMTLPMGIYQATTFDWSIMTATRWWETVYYSIGALILPYLFTYLGISKVPASFVGLSMAIVPVTSTVVAVMFYGVQLRTVDVIALVLVIISIIVAESKSKTNELILSQQSKIG